MSYTNVVFKQNITRNVDRDAVQRQRIDDRVGFQARFQTAGNLIFKPEDQSSLHVTEKQRFNKNHDTNDRAKRQIDRSKADRFYDARLNKRMERDQNRWTQQETKDMKEQQKRVFHQKVLIDNKRNCNGLGYNPISQNYEESQRGNKLKNYDESKQVSRFVRSRNIVQKNNSEFNIITGEKKQSYNTAVVPEKFQNRVAEKYEAKKQRQAVKYEPIRDKYDYLDD